MNPTICCIQIRRWNVRGLLVGFTLYSLVFQVNRLSHVLQASNELLQETAPKWNITQSFVTFLDTKPEQTAYSTSINNASEEMERQEEDEMNSTATENTTTTTSHNDTMDLDSKFCGECIHSKNIGTCQQRVDFLKNVYGVSDVEAKTAMFNEQPLRCHRHPVVHHQIYTDKTGRTVAEMDATYIYYGSGTTKLCHLLKNITNVSVLGLDVPSFVVQSNTTSTDASQQPPLVNFTLDCNDIFRNHDLGTGNWVVGIYMAQLAVALARANFQFQCAEGDMYKNEQILPWIAGFYNLSGDLNNPNWWPFDLDRPQETMVCTDHLPLHLASSVIQRDMRRFAIRLLGVRQGLPFDLNVTNLDLPHDLIPFYPTEDIDDVAIHFRCGDILGGALRDDFGVIKFDNYKRLIFPEARTIGISTQPFELERLRIRDRETAANCKRVVYTLVQYLSDLFPNSTVTVRNSINDTLPLTWARLIMANQTFTSLSSFGIFPAMGTFGQGYFQRGNSGVNLFNEHVPNILHNTHLMNSPVLGSYQSATIGIDPVIDWLLAPQE